MFNPIHTDRLVLRGFVQADGDRVVGLLNDFRVSRWLAKVPHPFTHADLHLINDDGSSRWPGLAAITLEGHVIGGINSDTHFGYWLSPDHWGAGYATEAGRAMVDHFFATRQDDVLHSGYFEGNSGSVRVLAKLGFQETERYMFFNRALGREAMNVDMILSRDDWQAHQ